MRRKRFQNHTLFRAPKYVMQNFSVRRVLNTLVVNIDFWVCKKQYRHGFLEKIFPFGCGVIDTFFVFSYLNLSMVTFTFQTPVKLKRSQMRILILILAMSLKTGPTTLCYFFLQKAAFGKVEKRKNHYGAFQAKRFDFGKS